VVFGDVFDGFLLVKYRFQHILYHGLNIHHKLTDILDDNGLNQLVEEPTRGEKFLDLINTNHPTYFRRIEVIPDLSDHDIVYAEIDILPVRNRQKHHQIPLYSKAKRENVRNDLTDIYHTLRSGMTSILRKYVGWFVFIRSKNFSPLVGSSTS
jgi:hypothetical protein